MGARAEYPGTGATHRSAQPAKLFHRLPGAVADVGDQLDLAGVELALDGSPDIPKPPLNGSR